MQIKGRMDKGEHSDVELKWWMQKRALRCGIERVDAKEGIMMWKSIWMDTEGIIISKLKGRMDKGGHYDVEMKGWMQKDGHYNVQVLHLNMGIPNFCNFC